MINAANIRTAIDELLVGTIGTIRKVTANSVQKGHDDEDAMAAISLTMATYEVIFGAIKNNSATPLSLKGSYRLVDLPITIEIKKHLPSNIEMTERDTARAAAVALADQIAQAIGYPDNLLQTNGALATGIIDGMFQDTRISELMEDWDKEVLTIKVYGTAIVKVDQAVS